MSRTVLVLLEHDRGQLRRPSLHALTAARQLGDEILSLVIGGKEAAAVADAATGFGAKAILLATDDRLTHPLADRHARILADIAKQRGASTIIAASSTFSKDILPRAAALLDAAMLTDVLRIEGSADDPTFHRPVQAGNSIAHVKFAGPIRILSIRATAFLAPTPAAKSPIEQIAIDPAALTGPSEFISREERQSGTRPDLAEARVVVAGGRPLKDRATFDLLIGGLADALGGAVASTRAAVDAGIADNDTQVGQTGKIVAPQLYFGIGISGAIQHLAGVKDSRIIVAINKDPDAPIFHAATYGLVGDLHQIVPKLIVALKS